MRKRAGEESQMREPPAECGRVGNYAHGVRSQVKAYEELEEGWLALHLQAAAQSSSTFRWEPRSNLALASANHPSLQPRAPPHLIHS